MSLKDKASLIFKPSRYKSGTLFSFRGNDFTYSRSSAATRVNAQGLIEEVASGVPVLNFDPTDLTKCPSLEFTPAKTNYVATSNIFTNWTTYQASVTANAAISPDGTNNAYKLINSSGNSYHFINYSSSGTSRTLSVFVKAAEYSVAGISSRSTNPFAVTYDLINETSTLTYDQNSVVQQHGIKKYANGWYRIWVAVSTMVQMNIHCAPYGYSGRFTDNDADGDGVSGIYIWEAQIENGTVPTSIIKTTGTSASRAQSNAVATVPDHTSGTFYLDIETIPASPIVYGAVGGATGFQNSIIIENSGALNSLVVTCYSGGTSQISAVPFTHSDYQKLKVAVTYQADELKIYVNGILHQTDTSATIPTLNGVGLARWVVSHNGDRTFATIYEAIQSDIVLSEAEAIALTSYDDYQELVDRNDLTWESPTITNNRLTALQEL